MSTLKEGAAQPKPELTDEVRPDSDTCEGGEPALVSAARPNSAGFNLQSFSVIRGESLGTRSHSVAL